MDSGRTLLPHHRQEVSVNTTGQNSCLLVVVVENRHYSFFKNFSTDAQTYKKTKPNQTKKRFGPRTTENVSTSRKQFCQTKEQTKET